MSSREKIAQDVLDLSLELVAHFDENATEGKGYDFYANSQITKASVFRNKLSARVGTYVEGYDVSLTLHENEITSMCNCTAERRICLHAIALMYAWVNDSDDFVNVHDVINKVKNFDKDKLVQIVTNFILMYPEYHEVILADDKLDWDEIDIDPELS